MWHNWSYRMGSGIRTPTPKNHLNEKYSWFYFGLVRFYGISTIVVYLRPNPVNAYCIWFVNALFVDNILNEPELICLHKVKWLYIWFASHLFIGNPYLPTPSARAGYDKRSIFKRSLTGLNSEFSF